MGWFKKLLGLDKPPVNVVSVTDSNFTAEVMKSDVPVLLDVWGPGCAPCARLAPVVMELSSKYAGRLKVAELNSADSPKTASRLHVMGTPTVIYFWQGKEQERIVGFRGQMYHEDYLENELLPAVEPPRA